LIIKNYTDFAKKKKERMSNNVIANNSEPRLIPDEDIDLEQLTSEQHDQRINDILTKFWDVQQSEMESLQIATEQDFKNHNDLPLARIKRIMKSDEDVRMISAEAPILFAKACEFFVLDLSIRAWGVAEKKKMKTIQIEDVKEAVKNTDIFDFLVDLPSNP
jgi:histone H3/H4